MSVRFRLGVSIWKLPHLWAAVCLRFPREEGLASCDAVLPLMLYSPSVGIPVSSLIGLFSPSLALYLPILVALFLSLSESEAE